MPTAKPKWGFVSGYWVPIVHLDDKTKREFTEVIGHAPPPEFFDRLEEILGDFCGMAKFMKTVPRPAEIKAALAYLSRESTKLLEALNNLDSYSRSLIRGVRFALDSSTLDTVEDCQKAVLHLSLVLKVALKRMPKQRGGARRQSAKEKLAEELAKLLERFNIELSTRQFEDYLSLTLDAAGETRGLAIDSIAKLARRARKRSR